MNKKDAFLAQSYNDAWNDYKYSLENSKAICWDFIIITASNEKQAVSYQLQIDKRIQEKLLPEKTKFIVISDPMGKRVGSGGSTLQVIKKLLEEYGPNLNWHDLKIMIIHSGGDSKRIPQYSAIGKLFMPIFRVLPDGRRSTLFDEIIINFSNVPSRCSGGMLIVPGDTEFIFNPLQLDLHSPDAIAISVKASVQEGSSHGVFLKDEKNYMKHFLHKKSENTLKEFGAVDVYNEVDIDTGFIWFGCELVKCLYNIILENGVISDDKCNKYINDKVRLSFYADFITPLGEGVTLQEYQKESPEANFSEELENIRTELWKTLHGHRLRVIQTNPALYIHLGTTQELIEMANFEVNKYQYLGWKKRVCCNKSGNYACNNAVVVDDANIDDRVYLEDCYIGKNVTVNRDSIISGVKLESVNIPANVVVHCLPLSNSKFVARIYGIEDNPKTSVSGKFLETSLINFINICGINNSEVWKEGSYTLWTAKIYPISSSEEEALNWALCIYRIAHGEATCEDIIKWKESKRISLQESFEQADTVAIIKHQQHCENMVRVYKCLEILNRKGSFEEAGACFDYGNQFSEQIINLLKFVENSYFSLKIRIYLFISDICKKRNVIIDGKNSDYYEDMCYKVIKETVLESFYNKYPLDKKIQLVKTETFVSLPARVNFCGSPSDAAPYCLEYGGTMLNAALLVNEKMPIQVSVIKSEEPKIILESKDLGMVKDYTGDLSSLKDFNSVEDPFLLHKAILYICGITNTKLENISSLIKELGSGFKITTSANLPKGSGLGTSSILAAAGVKAVNEAFGLKYDSDKIYAQVFAIEQLMNTGGGWQDQVGGYADGIKLIRSGESIEQKLRIDKLSLPDTTWKELDDRFVLVFSGQRRLARNVLRNEMNQLIRGGTNELKSLREIQKISYLMKYELEKGDIDSFAHYLSEQFILVKKLDKGASNTCIEYIFDVCEDLIEGKSICGAGGGGFLQIILKKGVSKTQLKNCLTSEFKDCGVTIWDSTFIR